MGEGIPLKWKSKESSSYNTHIRQNSLNKYYYKKTKRDTTKWWKFNKRKYNNYKCICTQLRNNSICKSNTKNHKGEKWHNLVGDFNTPFSSMDISSRQKRNKKTQALNDTLGKLNLTDIFKAFHPKAGDNTFFSSALEILQVGPQGISLSIFRNIEIIPNILSDHSTMTSEMNYKGKKKL